MLATERIAKYVTELRFEELPADVAARAKLCVLDWLGAGIAGAEQEPSRIVREVVLAAAGPAQATLLGTGDRVAAEQAALVNAFASSRGTHPTIEAMAALRAQSGVKPEEVVSATAHVNRTAFIADGRIREPSVGLEGKLCLAYCAALGFVEGRAGEREFRDDMVVRHDLKRFTRLVELTPEDDLTLDRARVVVRTADGREHGTEVDLSAPVPLEVEGARVEEKFRGLVEGRLSADRASAVLQMVASLETVQYVGELVEACVS